MRRTDRLFDRLTHLPLIVGIAAGVLVLFFAEWLIQLEQERVEQSAQIRLQAKVSSVRSHLESEINTLLSLGLSVSAFVSANPGFDEAQYEQLAERLFAIQPRIRNIAIAPGNVVRFIYPRSGNEAVLGIELEKIPAQRDAVLRVRREWQAVTAGPVNLVQGGLGLINRVPVLIRDRDGAPHYWGLVALSIDPLPVFERAGLTAGDEIIYALRGRDGTGATGEVFLGEAALFVAPDALQQEVVIPGGRWVLAARWRDKSVATDWQPLPWHVLAACLAFIAGLLAWFAAASQLRLGEMATHDSLTGLANRHQFLEQAGRLVSLSYRQNRPFVLLSLDLEDFKRINDEHGHEAGDAMLVHVADQALGTLRASDLIARFGGDEFLVLLPDTGRGDALDALIVRLREAIAQPLQLVGRTINVNVSIGIGSFPDDGDDLSVLMRVADTAMYLDKRSHKQKAGSA